MTDPMNTIAAEVAKALVQAGINGLNKLVKKVPALFKRQGNAKEQHVTDEVERTVTRLKAVTGSELEREQSRQEAVWEVLLRGLLVEYPEAAEELKTLAAELHAALPDTRLVGGVVGVVNAGRDSHVAGRDITINLHNPDRGESHLELSAVTLTETDLHDSAVLDLKLRNIGGLPAILHRAIFHLHDAVRLSPHIVLGFLPYFMMFPRGLLKVSHTYDIALPDPEQAGGSHHILDLSQEIEPAGTDRFHIRLGIPKTMDTLIYLLHFDINYDADRTLTSPTIAIAHPPGSRIIPVDKIRDDLHRFRHAVCEVRDAIDREMIIRGEPAPDWDNHPPTSRADLPANLRSVDGDPRDVLGARPGTYTVNDRFWNPDSSLAQRLRDIHAHYDRVVSIVTGADICHDSLPQILIDAQTVLAQFPALQAEFSTPEKATTAQETAPSGHTADELVRQLCGQHLEELRARANAGDQDAAGQLDTAVGLVVKIRRLGPDHPDALEARETLIFWRVNWDKAGAAVAMAELIPDQLRIYGPDHERILRARHCLAMCRGETGEPAGAVAAFVELVADRERVLGPDHPDTLDSRHELARWRGRAGDAAGAVAAFAELHGDRIRVQGQDHRSTLITRHSLAHFRGKAGDAAGAVVALTELIPDLARVLGPEHPDTLDCQHSLAHWQHQAGPESATLAQLPALHAELGMPEKAITVQGGIQDVTDELDRLVGGQHLEELRARANAGEQDAARELETAAGLADKIKKRWLEPDHPEALDARETLIVWWVKRDKAGAASALAQLIADQARVYGPDDPRTLRARHYLAMCRGATGDAAGAAEALADLVADRERVLGRDHPNTLASRNEQARWHAMAGDAAEAAATFAELVSDRIRVQGPDHRNTLLARYNLAFCRGKAGDAAGAAEAFAELVSDYIRVLGPDHPDTIDSQRALAKWRDQAGPESATLAQLPALHVELGMPEEAITVQETTAGGTPDTTDELVRQLGGQHLEELRTRANAGDQEAAGRLDAAADLAATIRRLGPDHPDALDARATLIFWRADWDQAGAAAALADLIPDQSRVYGPDDERTLRARHHLATYRAEPGHYAEAAAAFAELLKDWIRTKGPEHEMTLSARNDLAACRAGTGDIAGAAAAFAELLADQIRVLGPNHPETLRTLESQRALAHRQDQAGPESASAP